MMPLLLTPLLSSVLVLLGHQVTAQSGLQGIPGYLPVGYPTGDPPMADLGPNDVYQPIEAGQQPDVRRGDVILFPVYSGFELGQDGEQHIYKVVNSFDLQHQQYQPHSTNDMGGSPEDDSDIHV